MDREIDYSGDCWGFDVKIQPGGKIMEVVIAQPDLEKAKLEIKEYIELELGREIESFTILNCHEVTLTF